MPRRSLNKTGRRERRGGNGGELGYDEGGNEIRGGEDGKDGGGLKFDKGGGKLRDGGGGDGLGNGEDGEERRQRRRRVVSRRSGTVV